MDTDQSNSLFNLAADLVNHTSRHIFLTGKAGTGKTTFLRHIKNTTRKKAVIVAPTGVAAINAGGVTMHSFFQLPFGPFIPKRTGVSADGTTDRNSLFRNIHFSSSKRALLQELELVIIDEISMVRCDMLDAMDTILRHYRKKPLVPFGGVQMVYIGDLFQLPPVVSQQEWEILKPHYESPFFFHSHVARESAPLYIELKKIYRQSEQVFIDLLNRVRNNAVNQDDFEILNGRYNPSFQPTDEKYVTLTTHNRKADVINESELNKLPGRAHSFLANIKGEFPEKSFPTDQSLTLKEGAQVMFIKNDSGEERKYFNGKLAIVKKIDRDEITVECEEGEIKIEKEVWDNIRYNYNSEKDEMEEEELGSFEQFPLRLAWAITIHKSQGLTFERAVIDAGSAFAAGQVYVALSRCTSLQGLVLHSRIPSHAIRTDERILQFAKTEVDQDQLGAMLSVEKKIYQASVLAKAFDASKLVNSFHLWRNAIERSKLPELARALEMQQILIRKLRELTAVSEKFSQQLNRLLENADAVVLKERVDKAISYFASSIEFQILKPLQEHLEEVQHVARIKTYLKEMDLLQFACIHFIENLNHISFDNIEFEKVVVPSPFVSSKPVKTKAQKGSSHKETLALYKEGKTIEQIAALRNLARTTIEDHLIALIGSGEIRVEELVEPHKVEAIMEVLQDTRLGLSGTKQRLGDGFSYAEIKAVFSHLKFERNEVV